MGKEQLRLAGLRPQTEYTLSLSGEYGLASAPLELGRIRTLPGDAPPAAVQATDALSADRGARELQLRFAPDSLYDLEYRLAVPPGKPVHWYRKLPQPIAKESDSRAKKACFQHRLGAQTSRSSVTDRLHSIS